MLKANSKNPHMSLTPTLCNALSAKWILKCQNTLATDTHVQISTADMLGYMWGWMVVMVMVPM